MEIKPVSSVLESNGLGSPRLNTLLPTVDNYKVLLLQPKGQIQAGADGVHNRFPELAALQFRQFLQDALESRADLVITPEYSMPWRILTDSIKAGDVPALGALWALGCESIKYTELESLREELAPIATVLYEQLQPDAGRFLDPLVYLFFTQQIERDGSPRLVLLVQFKTHPLGDDDHFEISGMQRGTCVYQFGDPDSLRLVSLICSDAFAFSDNDARAIYDRALILHVQLNRKPRHEQFHGCRSRLLKFKGDQTEIICLNWAQDVHLWTGDEVVPWCNISASAWYLRPDTFDMRDVTLCANHRRGLYYTFLQPLRTHALFLNFEPATFLLEATKVAHLGVHGAVSRRRGPQLAKMSVWREESASWVEAAAEDGFSELVCESNQAAAEIRRLADSNPFEVERILALCAGSICHDEEWHKVQNLDSCVINASEVIRRITFCQDTDQRACDFRVARLKRCGHLWAILQREDQLPAALGDFKRGFHLEWNRGFPHQNAVSHSGERATVVYMGEESSKRQIETTQTMVAEFLHRSHQGAEQSLAARQRLAVWYREDDELVLYDPHRYTKFDQTGEPSEVDIARDK